MMRMFLWMLVFMMSSLALVSLVLVSPARAALTIDLSDTHIDVTSGFDGTQVSVFGTYEGKGVVAIVLRGPAKDMSVRRKENFLGAWVNRGWMSFEDAPVYYHYALSGPSKGLESVFKAKQIGLENVDFKTSGWISEERRAEFLKALIRNKQHEGLYGTEPGTVNMLAPGFFRADFYLPSRVPVGSYTLQAFDIANGSVRDVQSKTIKVVHVGLSAQIFKFSHKNAFLYGVLCVVLAVFAGWFSNRVRRRA